MTYEEFEKIVSDRGYKYIDNGNSISCATQDELPLKIITVFKQRWRDMLSNGGFEKLSEEEQIFISDLAWELACTPLDEREKKYYIRRENESGYYEYLNLKRAATTDEPPMYKSQFSQREFDELGLSSDWELELPEDTEKEDTVDNDKKYGGSLEGKRVHVTLLDMTDVDFYATLIYNSPTTYTLVDCTNERGENRIVANEYTFSFGKNELDYYEVVE